MTLDHALDVMDRKLNRKRPQWVILVNQINNPVATVQIPDELPYWKIYFYLSSHEMIKPFLETSVTDIKGEMDRRGSDGYICKIYIIEDGEDQP